MSRFELFGVWVDPRFAHCGEKLLTLAHQNLGLNPCTPSKSAKVNRARKPSDPTMARRLLSTIIEVTAHLDLLVKSIFG